ncbi:C25 family cysteine peptidase [Dokdonella sp.]|uniref:C25 family cysteine peptidase n=1 Tax=Dokdonella sp. TaxID=2291710 RepID=UPI00378479F9
MPSNFLLRATALILLAASPAAFACSGELHIELEHAGVYTLDHAAIVAAQPGLADCAVDDLWLRQAGKEVALRVVAAGARFADGDHVEWIGQPLHGPESWYDPYSVNNAYVLGAAAGTHARMREAEAQGSGHAALERALHLEQENLMIRLDQEQQKPGEEPDVWQWAKLTHVDPRPFELRFDLADLDVRGGESRLVLALRGLSALQPPPKDKGDKPADHVVELDLNGQTLAPLHWDGRDEVRRELQVATSRLKVHGNTLTLRVPKRELPWAATSDVVDVVMLNWIEAHYPAEGNLDADTTALRVRADASASLQLVARGNDAPMLYGSDGVRRVPRALGGDRYAYAPAAAGVDLLPATAGSLAKPLSLRAVTGSEWREPKQGYDYLIVAHPRLVDAIRPLARFHEKRGLKVALLDIDAVYDQFNHGIAHPQAIRNLVDTAYHRWPSKPRFLLLVGDSSFDIRHETYNDLAYAKWTDRELLFPGHFGAVPGGEYENKPKKLSDRNLIPTWQFPSPEGQSASDNWFGAVNGDDWHPVVAVGRFPVVEPAEVTAIVDKTIDYITKPQLGAWRRDVMFISDEIASFQKASDEIAGALGKVGFLADKVYAKPDVTENAVHQRAIHDGIDEGRLLVHFIGHGGRYIWRTGPPDLRKNQDLFTLDDVSKLGNGGRLPMVLSMTCYSAPFDNPTEDSIGERFLREKDKGAVAVFAASWRNTPSPAFSKTIIENLLEPGATIGEAIVRAKNASQDRILVEMYNLLGDPALVLERPRDALLLALDDDRWNRGVLVDLKQARFDGKVTVDWLDARGTKLASSNYQANDTRFRLPIPSFGKDRATQLRIYAVSRQSGRDAVGGLDFGTSKEPARAWTASAIAWWKRLTQPAPKRSERREDTIAILDFDGPAR